MPPDRWLVLTARVARVDPEDPLRGLLVEGLLALGGLSVVEEGDSLTTYLRPPRDPQKVVEQARHFLGDWIGGDPPELSWRWQRNEDWEREWRRGLQPRKVSPRFVVKPTWTEWQATAGEIVLEIDPEMAFGTGEHATTRGCLRLLDRWFRDGDRVLDIGSGSGILSIAAARLGAPEVIAVEHDSDANLNARQNIERNDVVGVVLLLEERADAPLLRRLGRFDLILANILSGVIRPLLPALSSTLQDDGRLIISGILLSEKEDVMEDARAVGLEMQDEDPEDEWWSATLAVL
ncbi:MAG: methyltransferase domain-containing protein [Gemmatimonas sp.]|nr:methyltransferase domain-containing protein [Gemmatimonas sp.]